MLRWIRRAVTHGAAVALGFALGIYALPILTAPPSPDAATLEAMAQGARYAGTFAEDLRGHDLLHWGEGEVSLTDERIVHVGRLAPGPDYMVYLVPDFVGHEDEFAPLEARSARIGPVRTFDGFVLEIPDDVDLEAYTTVLIWCEAFSEFIAAAAYR